MASQTPDVDAAVLRRCPQCTYMSDTGTNVLELLLWCLHASQSRKYYNILVYSLPAGVCIPAVCSTLYIYFKRLIVRRSSRLYASLKIINLSYSVAMQQFRSVYYGVLISVVSGGSHRIVTTTLISQYANFDPGCFHPIIFAFTQRRKQKQKKQKREEVRGASTKTAVIAARS